MKVSYFVTDKFSNVFRCNFAKEQEEYSSFVTRTLEVGAKCGKPCVRIDIDEDEQSCTLEEVTYDSLCAFDGLPHGEQGTRSMVLTSLIMCKFLVPSLRSFSFQDDAELTQTRTSPPICLADYFLLTRGQTWYTLFLQCEPLNTIQKDIYKSFLQKMHSILDMSESAVLKIYGSSVLALYLQCQQESTSLMEYHRRLFETFPRLKHNSFFKKLIAFHSGDTIKSFHGWTWSGNIDSIDKSTVKRIESKPWESLFHVHGGGNQIMSPPYISRRRRLVLTVDEL